MDREQLLGIAGLLAILSVMAVGAWFASRHVGWGWTLAGGALAVAAFSLLLRRLGDAIFFVAAAVVVMAVARLVADPGLVRGWFALVLGAAGLWVGSATGLAEAEARIRPPYATLPNESDSGDGPA